MLTSILAAAHYFFIESAIDSKVALIMCLISFVRTLFALIGMNRAGFNGLPLLIIFLMVNTAVFVWGTNWNTFHPVEVLTIVGAYATTIAFFFRRMAVTKVFVIAGCLMWLIYEFSVGVYSQMIGEGFTIFANVLALVLIVRALKAGEKEEGLKDIDAQVIRMITRFIPRSRNTGGKPSSAT